MPKKSLVTGGAGFIGSHLCKKLLDIGHQVICVDNFSTGSRDNIINFINNKNFKLIDQDILLPLKESVDEIYNLASPASPVHYQKDPLETLKILIFGAINLFELARKNKSKILQASSSEIYGNSVLSPQSESYYGNVNTVGDRSCYSEGKRCAETISLEYKKKYNIDVSIVRIFNTYGPKMQPEDGRVVSNFITQALNNNNITVYGDGSQTRSFQYIDDLIRGLIKTMKKDDFFGPVNIGNPYEIDIESLAKKILYLIPESQSKIVYSDLPQDDPMCRKPDIKLAKHALNWEPLVGLEDGLKKTIAYYRNL